MLGLRLVPDPLRGGLATKGWPVSAQALVDYWAWKYDYVIFYSEMRRMFRSYFAAEIPNGIRSGLWLVGRLGFLSFGPRDRTLCLVERPKEFMQARIEISQGQKILLPVLK